MFNLIPNLSDFDKGRRELSARVRNLAPVLPDIGEMFRSSIDQNFAVGGRFGSEPFGGGKERWKISIRAREQGGQTLLDTRRLSASVGYSISGNTVSVGSNVIYGALHHFGKKIEGKSGGFLYFRIGKRGSNLYRKRSVTIPARPWLVLQSEDVTEAVEIVASYVIGGLS